VPQGQQEAAAALRVLQAVDQQVEEGDPERLQDVDALDQYGTLLPGEGGGDQASRRSTPGPGGDDNAADVQTSDEEGGNDVTVPVRVNRRRIKWRHQMDQELLRVVLLQRAEVGFHTKQFWSRLKGLPASCSACHKRYKLLQRKLPEAMQQLEGQVGAIIPASGLGAAHTVRMLAAVVGTAVAGWDLSGCLLWACCEGMLCSGCCTPQPWQYQQQCFQHVLHSCRVYHMCGRPLCSTWSVWCTMEVRVFSMASWCDKTQPLDCLLTAVHSYVFLSLLRRP
jgi:hypothetical protein